MAAPSEDFIIAVVNAKITYIQDKIKELEDERDSIMKTYPMTSGNFQDKWDSIVLWINNYLRESHRHFGGTEVPRLEKCVLNVREDHSRSIDGRAPLYWELILPQSMHGGMHWKIVDITNVCEWLPKKNGDWLNYLIEKKYCNKFVKFL